MLVQFAFIVFAMFAVLSLVIDVGYVRLTQVQMQGAADAAAIEGLRKRDVGVPNAGGVVINDPFASDCQRRASANRLVHWTFDDDFDAANGDPDYQFGAGPTLDISGGTTNLHALAAIGVPETHAYKPDLQLNQENAVYGDMVSGRFCYTDDPLPSEDAAYVETIVCTEQQRAEGSYARNDFNPAETVPQPPASLPTCPLPDEVPPSPWPLGGTGSISNTANSAFLVRLRRSNELAGFSDQTEPTVASSGPALPLLFGRGTTIHGDSPASEYSIRRDGVTVRATAIAQVRPALHVGLPQSNPVRPGVTPFALSDLFVESLGVPFVQATINPLNGLICRGTVCVGVPPLASIGRYVDNLAAPSQTNWMAISTVGQTLPAPVPLPCVPASPFSGFGPVYSLMGSGANRIIGFTRITMIRDPQRILNPCAVLISRGVSLVASSNATAHLADGFPLGVGTSSAEFAQLLDKNLVRNGEGNYNPVLVPVLAR
jgi:hypothetical protein